MLVRVVGNNFVAGFVIEGGVCTVAAPILRKLFQCRTPDEIRRIIAARGWTASVLLPQRTT